MSWTRVLLTLLALWLAACAESDLGQARTQVLLRIHIDDEALRAQMSDLGVSLFRREGAEWIMRGNHVHSMRQLQWPVDIPILPSNEEAATKDFEVIVRALDGGTVLAQARVVSAFVSGDWRLLELTLFRCSGGPAQPACSGPTCHGEACAECAASGDCEAVGRVDPREQPRFDPNAPDAATDVDGSAAEPALRPNDAGGAEAASRDADAGVSQGQREAGSPPLSIDAAAPVDAAVSPDASAIAQDGASGTPDAGPADPCADVTCASGAVCTDVSGVGRCQCKSGFMGDGGGCTPTPSCASLGCSAQAECVGSGNTLRCQCLSGYTGSGTSCTDINECTTNNGGCGNPVYNTCTNRLGAAATCAIGGTFGAVQRGPVPSASSSAMQGPYTVQSYSEGFADSPDHAGATIYYPTPFEATPFAAVAGITGFAAAQSAIADWGPGLASHGFITILVDPNTTSAQPAQRAIALLAGLETLRAENTRSGSPLQGHVRTTHMGVFGWSMGGGGALRAAVSSSQLKAVIGLGTWDDPPMQPGLSVPVLLLGADPAMDTIAGTRPGSLYDSFPLSTPRLLFLSSQGNTSLTATPKNLNGEIGRYAVAWLRVFLDGDLRYRQFLNGPEAPVFRFASGALP
jgi:hypothetical protein